VPAPVEGERAPPPIGYSALARSSPLDLAVEVATDAPGILVFGEPWYPGWHVTVDGKTAPLMRVDYALRGVSLSPGQHAVAMVYEDDPLAYGGAATLTGLAALIGLALWVRRARHKRVD
jgi:uncharacterized membrane protein YfhO